MGRGSMGRGTVVRGSMHALKICGVDLWEGDLWI